MDTICSDPDCPEAFRHYHGEVFSPDGTIIPAIISMPEDFDPRAEVRDSETGEVLFAAVKGPLQVIEGGRLTTTEKG